MDSPLQTEVPQSSIPASIRPSPTKFINPLHTNGITASDAGHAAGAWQKPPVGNTDSVSLKQEKRAAKAVLAASGIASADAKNRSIAKSPPTSSALNGGRKRSRSGSILASSLPETTQSLRRHTPGTKIELEQLVDHEYHHKALVALQKHNPKLVQQKREEVQLYENLRQRRHLDPGSIFGYGYQGPGNPRTEARMRDPIVYPEQRRLGHKQTRIPRLSRREQAIQAEQVEQLVPIRLDIEWDKIKLRDTFTWNLHDRSIPIPCFAEKLVEDFSLQVESCRPLLQQVSQSIQEQLCDYYPHIFLQEPALDPHLPYMAYKNDEMRVLIKLNITIGQSTLIDQFEWEMNNPANCAEDFARQMTRELSLPGEFTTAIAHSIREQCQLFSKSLYITGHPFDGRPIEDADLVDALLPSPVPATFRPFQSAKDFTPYLYELNEADLEKAELSISREQRRQKRSTNRRGGPALPDLKDRQRTVRSLVLSSVIPGAASTLEESRIFKLSRASRRSGRGAGAGASQRDGLDESEESETEDSTPNSPALPTHLLQGTARTRGMRGAASAAQAAVRANLNAFGADAPSKTPEPSSHPQHSLHHEPRVSARKPHYREDSDDDIMLPERLVVMFKVPRHRLRDLVRKQRLKERHGSRVLSGSPMHSLNSRSISATPPLGSMASHPLNPSSTSSTATAVPTMSSPAVSGRPRPMTDQYGVVDAPFPDSEAHPAVSGELAKGSRSLSLSLSLSLLPILCIPCFIAVIFLWKVKRKTPKPIADCLCLSPPHPPG